MKRFCRNFATRNKVVAQNCHFGIANLKKFKHIINWTIWSVLALYVLLVVLIQLPFMQRQIGRLVEGAVSGKLGTEVSVGRVNLGFFNRLIIDDVAIKDQRQEDLLQVRRMSVKMELLPLLDGRVAISSAQLFGARLHLYRDSAGAVPNYQFAVDALSSPDNDDASKLDLRIGSLIVRSLALGYDQLDAPSTPGRFNPLHLSISDVSAHILLRALDNDQLSLLVKRISLKEQSGLELRQLAFKLEADKHAALLSDLSLQTQNSHLSVDSLNATYQLDSLKNTLSYDVNHFKCFFVPGDFACLLPAHFPADHSLQVDAAFSGGVRSLVCRHLDISSPDESLQLQLSGRLHEAGWHANVSRLNVSSQLLTELHDLLPSVPPLVDRLGNVSLAGSAYQDDLGRISAQGNLHTGLGQLALHGDMTPEADTWTLDVGTDSLDMQRLLAHPSFGLLAARLHLSGRGQAIGIEGAVPRIDWQGYSYRDLSLDGSYSPQGVEGKLKLDDPNLLADVEGSVSLASRTPRIRLTGNIGSVAPQTLHLTDYWGDAVFSAVIDADFSASSLADAEGTVDLDDFIMIQGDTARYHLDNLHVKSGYADGRHFLRLNSDFGEMELQGKFYWNTLAQSLASAVPMLTTKRRQGNNDFVLAMRLTDSQWLKKLTGIPLDLEGPMHLNAQVCDSTSSIEVSSYVSSFLYGADQYHDATLRLTTQGDSSLCNASLTRLTDNGKPLYVKLAAHTSDSQLFSTLTLNTEGTDGGTVNTITSLYQNDKGLRETHVRVMPSELTVKGQLWELEPCDILYSEKRLMVDQFTIHHGDEHLIIDGIASTSQGDSLLVDLRGVDIASLLDIVNFHSVEFGGRATGRAYICQAFDNLQAWADIFVPDFLFQYAPMGKLEAHAFWNADEGQVDLDAFIDDGADAQTYIDGYVSPRQQQIELGIRARGTSIGFVHSFTNSFVGHIEGHAHGDVRVHGPLKGINLSGEAVVDGLATITPLGIRYTFHDDTVRMVPDTIMFRDFIVYDRDLHTIHFDGAVGHHDLKDFYFDLQGTADHLLAYDFPQLEPGSTIGGTIWADGQTVIRGRSGEVVIDCDVTPASPSFFIYNAASPDAVSNQQFITWGEASQRGRGDTAHYDEEQGSSLPVQAASTSGADNAQDGGRSDLRINLRINAIPDATLRLLMDQRSGDYITLNGSGVLRASYYNKGPFQMFGTYNVERGTYSMTIQNILKKIFQFQPGSSLVFGGDPLQAALNLKARHTVNGVSLSDLGLGNSFTSNTIRVNCLMNILGTAGEPRVEFDLEMPTVNSEEEQMIRSIIASEQELNQQVVYLLGIGRFYTQGANNASTQGYGQTELAMQSLLSSTVSSQINQILSQVIKNDDWNFGANISTGNEGWHNAEYEGLFSGRMLNNRLLINGQFGYRDNATQAAPSFIGDFDIQYVLTPGGSLSLKAYNQTNDRYFTHSSLNTQGIGIIMKKDFNGLKDLFTIRRKKNK